MDIRMELKFYLQVKIEKQKAVKKVAQKNIEFENIFSNLSFFYKKVNSI